MKRSHFILVNRLTHAGAGFTLVEILISIAIIGVIATVVITNLENIRGKGVTGAIIGDMKEFQGFALTVYQDKKSFSTTINGGYTDVCSWPETWDARPTEILTAVRSLVQKNGIPSTFQTYYACRVSLSGQQFFLAAPNKSGTYWCVDGEGDTREITLQQAQALSNQSAGDGPGFTCNPND